MNKMRITRSFSAAILAAVLGMAAATGAAAAAAPHTSKMSAQAARSSGHYEEWLKNEVRHQLVLLPWYSVFDNLEYKVDGTTVTLYGQVAHATLMPDAERAVKRIEGVEKVVNNIEVLPPSPNDERIRRATYRAIYGDATLERYALQAVPSIHIIVKGGNVTLEGMTANQADKDVANIRASGVSGVFSVTNHLAVENK